MAVSASAPADLQLRGFVHRYMEAWNDCDTDALQQLITEDVEWADPALPEPARGVAAVQEFMRASCRAFPDLRFGEPDPPVCAVTGDVVLWAWYVEGTHRGPLDPPGFAQYHEGCRDAPS
jgi:ketosteroid isomerase-like protein